MLNTIEEMYQKIQYDELIELFEKCLSKNSDEIIDVFKEKGHEISDNCALECFKCFEAITPIEDPDLSNIAGGSWENYCLPGSSRIKLDMAIKELKNCKIKPSKETGVDIIQGIIDDLNNLLSKSHDKTFIKSELKKIEIRILSLQTTNKAKDKAFKFVLEVELAIF